MKLANIVTMQSGQCLLGVAALIFSAASAFGQTMQLSAPAPAGINPLFGEYLALTELPRPEWQEVLGTPVARLRLMAPDAAAWRVAFRSMSLPKDAQVFLYGMDAGGAVRAVHGPYEGNGPLNVPGFETEVIEGAELTIELRGVPKAETLPFEIDTVERINASQLAALKQQGTEVEPMYRPEKVERQASEVRSAWFEDELVLYRVIDGMAVMDGDIVLGPADEVESGMTGKSKGRRESHEITSLLWPQGVIPYTIQYETSGITKGSSLETKILGAIAYWNQRFPGILVPRTTQADYVTFRFRSGVCEATIGRIGLQQFISLTTGCTQGTIVHEIGHALGFHHEHKRPDRSSYVAIAWDNIQEGKEHNFTIPSSGTSRSLGPYDYGSIMHYGPRDFGIDGATTIFPLRILPPGVIMGQQTGLSAGDEAGVRMRYCNAGSFKLSIPNASGPNHVRLDPAGGTFQFTVMAPPYCTWTLSETANWITVHAPLSRSGTSTVYFSTTEATADRRDQIRITSYLPTSQSSRQFVIEQYGN